MTKTETTNVGEAQILHGIHSLGKQQTPPAAERREAGKRFTDPLQNKQTNKKKSKKENPFLR